MNHTFLDEHARLESPIHRLDARLKIVLAICFAVAAVSTPAQARLAFAAYASCILVVLLLSRVPPLYFLKRLAVVLPFVGVVAIFIPFLPDGRIGGGYNLGWGGLSVSHTGLTVFWNVLAKSLLGASAAILLTATTPFSSLLNGMALLRVPRVVILIVSFAYRYLFVFIGEAQRMTRARDSRCYTGRWIWQAVVAGQMIGTLFLRSYERGERVYLAMCARGYEGESFERHAERPPLSDLACTGVASLLLLSIRLCVAW